MVFKKQDLTKLRELTLTDSRCEEKINAEIQCLFLLTKKLGENLEKLEKAIDLKINGEIFEIKKLEFDESKIIIDLEYEIFVENLELRTSLSIDKIELYRRKFRGLLVAARPDAFGARMFAFIFAMYLASKIGLKFGFVWHEINKDKSGLTLKSAEELFEKEFLDDHDYTNAIHQSSMVDNWFKSINELNLNPIKESWGSFVTSGWDINKTRIIDLNEEEYRREFSNLFFNLPLRAPYRDSMLMAEDTASRLGNFVAIHIRGGDVVEHTHYRVALFFPQTYGEYLFPVDLAVFSAKHFIRQKLKVVLFSADAKASLAIKEYLNDEVLEKNFFITSDFYENFNEMQTLIFDTVLMSKADKILANGSGYPVFARSLGQGELLNLTTYFDKKELYRAFIVPQQKDIFNVSSAQKATSCIYAYTIAQKINIGFGEKVKLLNLALEFDVNNCGIKVMILDEFFKQGYVNRVENCLKDTINERCEEFIATLLLKFWGYHVVFQVQFDFYLNNANENFPYISFVAAKIAEFNKDFERAKKYVNLALRKEHSNELFLELSNALKGESLAKTGTATQRIHNHLSYKLGQIMIRNSKSLLGFIKMPYLLIAMTLVHKEQEKNYREKIRNNPSLALPPLESYRDYTEALKEKQCFTYKLGQSFIKASKNWYKGGYIKFYFEAKALEREFRRGKN